MRSSIPGRRVSATLAATLLLLVTAPGAIAGVEATRTGGVPVADLFPGARFDPTIPTPPSASQPTGPATYSIGGAASPNRSRSRCG